MHKNDVYLPPPGLEDALSSPMHGARRSVPPFVAAIKAVSSFKEVDVEGGGGGDGALCLEAVLAVNVKRDESSPLGYQRSAGARRAGSLRALSSAKNLFIGCQESFFENDCPCSSPGHHLSINSHLPPPHPPPSAPPPLISFSPAPLYLFQ